MFNVATIGTKNYFPLTKRLLASLENSGNDFHLTVFCDDSEVFRTLDRAGRCTVRELPEIRAIGVKRARFVAYSLALQNGGFLYLDSDVIVLKPIHELVEHSRITGCYDDLSSVRIIEDKQHPWAGDPTLENRWFINSGVFFAPRGRREFFDELLARSQNDELWHRYGVLYDNSFLCAHFNLLGEMVEYVDSRVYNWQGFVVDGQLQVERSGDSLVNRRTGQVLKIAHFAGVPNPDAAMCCWPVEVTSLLASRGSTNETSRNHALVEFLGTLNPDFDYSPQDSTPRMMLNALLRETVDLAMTQLQRDYSKRNSYLVDREIMLSLAHSKPTSKYRWNGLLCGGAYLDGEEYNLLLHAIRKIGVRSAIHTGTEETARLFHDFEVDALRVQVTTGTRHDRLGDDGCQFALVNVDPHTGKIDRVELRGSANSRGIQKCDLLLIESPPNARLGVGEVEQLAGLAQPRYVAWHAVRRDCETVFAFQQRCGLRLVAYLPSDRGFALFEFPSPGSPEFGKVSLSPFDSEETLANPRVRIQLADERLVLMPEDHRGVSLTVTNLGDQTLSPHFSSPVFLSYHWISLDNQVKLWDGLRSVLPFDILPGCSATVEATIGPAPDSSCSQLCVTLVQESVCWFDDCDLDNRLLVQLDGDKAFAKQ